MEDGRYDKRLWGRQLSIFAPGTHALSAEDRVKSKRWRHSKARTPRGTHQLVGTAVLPCSQPLTADMQ